jgi:OOP family OmpA-OmpF porin
MKHLILLTILLQVTTYFYAQNTVYQSLLNVTVTDFEMNPSIGDKIFFISKKTGDIYTGLSDKDGKFQIKLPNGSEYQIKIKTFDQEMNYLALDIPETESESEYDIGIKYELPKTYTLKNVLFATNSATLLPSSYESLNELAEFMLLKTTLKIELAGHTDSDGNDGFNLSLSQKRADAVRNYLIKKGVQANRMTAVGYGETQPIADNNTEDGKQLNRRTEVRVLED